MFDSFAIDHIVGDSPWAQRVRKRILQVARYDYSVLITGPSGTGKELVARAVHAHSSREKEPFIPVDCATIPSGLFSSQLFGHLKGAFTGASHAAMGCFRAAEGGTIFLDEIGELDLDLQAKLLRVLQEKKVVPVGGHDPIPVNVRVLAATHRDLKAEVKAGRFRLDLYYRLNVVRVESDALKDRTDDIPVLTEHFLAKTSVDNGLPLKRLSKGALAKLKTFDWPGNVRELEHAIERAVVFTEGSVIGESAFDDLGDESISDHDSEIYVSAPATSASFERNLGRPPAVSAADDSFEEDLDEEEIASLPFVPPADSPAAEALSEEPHYDATQGNWPSLAEIEMEHIKRTLKETFYNQSAAARLLDIDRKQLARKIKKYGLEVPRMSRGRPVHI